jgi:hypothetical protein
MPEAATEPLMSDKPAEGFEAADVYKLAEGVRVAREMVTRAVNIEAATLIAAEHFKVALSLLQQAEHQLTLSGLHQAQAIAARSSFR